MTDTTPTNDVVSADELRNILCLEPDEELTDLFGTGIIAVCSGEWICEPNSPDQWRFHQYKDA